jgi:hypothetical protein
VSDCPVERCGRCGQSTTEPVRLEGEAGAVVVLCPACWQALLEELREAWHDADRG